MLSGLWTEQGTKALHLEINKNECGRKIHEYFTINLHNPRCTLKKGGESIVNVSGTDSFPGGIKEKLK